jgi:hypothetical protein
VLKDTPPQGESEASGRPASGNVSYLSALALVGQLGLVMAASVVMAVLLGIWVDGLFGGGGALVAVGAIGGVIAGLFGVYRILRKEIP